MANGDALIRVGNAKVTATAFSPRVLVTGFALAASVGTPGVAGGAVSVAGYGMTTGLGTPTIVVSSTVQSPTGVSMTASVGSVTFTGLGADLHVRVGATSLITAPGFTAGAATAPTGLEMTMGLGTPSAGVINGANPTGYQLVATASGAGSDIDADVGVDGYGLTASLGTPSVAGVSGDNAVQPVGFGLTASLGTPVFPADATVNPIANGTNGPAGMSLSSLFDLQSPYFYNGAPIWGYSATPVVVVASAPVPTGQGVTVSLGTPLVQVGSEQTDATVPVGGFDLTVGFNSAGTFWPVEHTAAGFGLTVGFGTAAVSADDAVDVSGYELTMGLGFPVPVADATVAVTGFGLTASLGTPTTAGNITIRPTGFLLVTSRGTPTLGGTDLNRPLVITDRSGPRYGVRWAAGPRYELETRSHPRYWAQEVRMATNDKVYFNNDDEPEYYITRRNTSTGEVEPAAGLANVICYLSALPMPNHTAIHANLSITLTERASAPGYYYGVMQGSDIATHLATYANKAVYRILDIGSDVEGQERVTVLAKRPIL